MPDTSREVGLLYGACDSREDEYAMRVAYLIAPDGSIAEAHEKVNAAQYPHEQLASLKERVGRLAFRN